LIPVTAMSCRVYVVINTTKISIILNIPNISTDNVQIF
jgi:hypothetical protein